MDADADEKEVVENCDYFFDSSEIKNTGDSGNLHRKRDDRNEQRQRDQTCMVWVLATLHNFL
jgi:hypothetical protein